MLLKKVSQKWSFLKGAMVRVISSAQKKMIEHRASPSSCSYRSANDCPFTVFESCLIDEDYKVLGGKTEQENLAVWAVIYNEYLMETNQRETEARKNQISRIQAIHSKVEMVKALIRMIIEFPLEDLVQVLRDCGYPYIKEYGDLNKVLASIKREEMELKMLVNNLPKQDEAHRVTRKHFDDLLFQIQMMLHTIIDKKQLTVMQFCVLYRNYSKQIEMQNAQLQKEANYGKR